MENKETLQWYKDKNKPRWESCYDGSWEAKLLFKAKSESLEVNSRTYRWDNGGDGSAKNVAMRRTQGERM